MNTAPQPPVVRTGYRNLWTLGLAAAALVANYFPPVLFANHTLVLGAVFYWVALRLLDPGRAGVVLLAGAGILWERWGQPYSAGLIALEAIAVGAAWRRGRNPLVADLGFWLVVGTPLSWFLYRHVTPIPSPSFEQALVVQPLNGLLAVWIAYLLREQIPGTPRDTARDFRGVLLRRYVAFGTLPVVAATLIAVRSFEARALAEADANLRSSALNLSGMLSQHVAEASASVREFAARQRVPGWTLDPATLRRELDTLHARSGVFITLLAADAEGRIAATAPSGRPRAPNRSPRDEQVTDRDYFTIPMLTGRPLVSGVFRGRGLGRDLLIAVSAPIMGPDGRPAGIIEGSLMVSTLEEIIRRASTGPQGRVLLADSRLQVIAGSGFEEAPLQSLQGTSLGRLITNRRPKPVRFTGDQAGRRVSYLSTTLPLPELGWSLTVQREWADVLRPVVTAYLWSTLIVVATVLAASLFATWSLRGFLQAWRNLIAFAHAPTERVDALRESALLDLPLEFRELIRDLAAMADRLKDESRRNQELLAGLEARVRERTRDLEQAVANALAADRAKGAFLATVSHELRTPLTAIITGVRLLRLSPEGRPDREARTLETLEKSSQALMAVISDILDYSTLEAGALRMQAAPFAPAQLAADVESILEPAAHRAGLAMRAIADHPRDLAWKGDAQRVKQVLLNLAGNAVKFAPAGEIRIAVWTTEEPRRLWFSVTDEGPGIPADRLESVFEPFVQLETNRVQSHAGTGLGLSISRRLVELMGGRIRAVDTGGRGARFEFWLPEEPPAPNPPAGPPVQ